jgi:hypothetical protein
MNKPANRASNPLRRGLRLHAIACLLLAANISTAVAAPLVPSSVMPGRERDRFTDSPVERFMRPGPYVSPPVIGPASPGACNTHPSRHSKPRSQQQKQC